MSNNDNSKRKKENQELTVAEFKTQESMVIKANWSSRTEQKTQRETYTYMEIQYVM